MEIGKSFDEAKVVVDTLCDACLLEDDFGNPDVIGVGGFSPGQGSFVVFVPIEELSMEVFNVHADGVQESVFMQRKVV